MPSTCSGGCARLRDAARAALVEAQVVLARRAHARAFEDRRLAVRAGARRTCRARARGAHEASRSPPCCAVAVRLRPLVLARPSRIRPWPRMREPAATVSDAGLEVADEHAGVEQLDALRGFDVAFELAGDDDLLRAHATVELGALLDGQVALDVDVALELAGDADVAGAFDLAFDGQVGGDQRFLDFGFAARRRGMAAGAASVLACGSGSRCRRRRHVALRRRARGRWRRRRVLLGRGGLGGRLPSGDVLSKGPWDDDTGRA